MPTYKFHLKNGKTLKLEGDTQPSDEEVEGLAKENGVELVPSSWTDEQVAANQRGEKYLEEPMGHAALETVKNIPSDVAGQAKGLGDLVFSVLPKATAELGGAIGGRVRETFGFDPKYPEGTPNLNALASMPMSIVNHYKGYGDEGIRAAQMREHPVGTALDIAAPVEAAKRGAATKVMTTPIQKPSAATVAGTAADAYLGGAAGVVRGAARGGIGNRLMSMFGKGAEEAPKLTAMDEAAARLREATAVGEPPMMSTPPIPKESKLIAQDESGWWFEQKLPNGETTHGLIPIEDVPTSASGGFDTGRIGMPRAQESLRSQGQSLLSPESQRFAESLNVSGPAPKLPSRPVPSHNQVMADVAQPGFEDAIANLSRGLPKTTASAGTVRVPPGAELGPDALRPRTLAEAYALIGEEPPVQGPTALDVQGGRMSAPPARPSVESSLFADTEGARAARNRAGEMHGFSATELGAPNSKPPMTRPVPKNPNAGGKLQPRSQFSPQGALNMALRETPESVTVPERPQPGFKLSLDSRDAMDAWDQPVPSHETSPATTKTPTTGKTKKAPASRASAAAKSAASQSDDATYYRLKVKPHLTDEEQAIFNKLEAKRKGTAYAAGRKS